LVPPLVYSFCVGGASMEKVQKKKRGRKIEYSFYFMVLPAIVLVAIYYYGPLVGWSMAFQRYDMTKGLFGSPYVGWDNFKYLFTRYPGFWRIIRNTLTISVSKLIVNFCLPIIIALLLNEIKREKFKKSLQTMMYLPHFISWVIISGLMIDMLSPTDGVVNAIIKAFGGKAIYFLGTPNIFPAVMVVSDAWKSFGFSTILYLAALTSIDPQLYEAATIDGASRWKRTLHITLPGIVSIMVLSGILSLGNLLNAGFDQIFNLYNPAVYSTGDVLDTFTYRIGFKDWQYDMATAVGMVKSCVSLLLVSLSYYLAYKFADYRIF
jgi:putative aldouronate transport system permease protein